jgi:hypothetical protein
VTLGGPLAGKKIHANCEQPSAYSQASFQVTEARFGGLRPSRRDRAGPHLGGGPDIRTGSDPAGRPPWARLGHRQRSRGSSLFTHRETLTRKNHPWAPPAVRLVLGDGFRPVNGASSATEVPHITPSGVSDGVKGPSTPSTLASMGHRRLLAASMEHRRQWWTGGPEGRREPRHSSPRESRLAHSLFNRYIRTYN